MGGACGMHRKIEKCAQVFGGKTCKKRDHLEDPQYTNRRVVFAHTVPLRSSQHAHSARQ